MDYLRSVIDLTLPVDHVKCTSPVRIRVCAEMGSTFTRQVEERGSTIGEGGDTTISSLGRSPK